MRNTISDNIQLFNIKAFAEDGTDPGQLVEGQFGIIDESTGLIVGPVPFDSMPDEFSFVSILNGKLYTSFGPIKKECCKIDDVIAQEYVAPVENKLEAVLDSCNCINGIKLQINISDQELIQRDGLTWTHSDFYVEISPQEVLCHCDCSGTHPVYENNVLTVLLAKAVNNTNSPFYEAELTDDTGTVIDPSQYDQFVEDNKAVNTDDDPTNDGSLLTFVLKGKVRPTPVYNDLEVNYVYPRGTRLSAALSLNNGEKNIPLVETQELGYEINAGYDMRALEFNYINMYTDLNFYPQLSDGIKNPDLVYQFENGKEYNTVSFEFDVKKTWINDAPSTPFKRFGVILATEDPIVYTQLKDMMGVI